MEKILPTRATTSTGPLVVALVYDGLCTLEFAIAAEIFGLHRPEMGSAWYRFASAAIEPGPLRAQGGLTVAADGGPELLEQADLVVIPGWRGAHTPVPPALVQALRAAWARGARLASICSGAFVLAATGLLDGRRAATHWRYAEVLRQQHPAIEVDAQVLYTGAERVFSSAGSAAGIDLLLHLVRSDFGVAAANSVARRLVMPPHRAGGQAQFIERPVPVDRQHRLAGLMEQVRLDLASPWTVALMAQAARMSPRSLARRMGEATGMSPAQWLIAERVAEAQRLLEGSVLSVEQIAHHVGFASLQALRHHFQAQFQLAPRDYRRMYAAPKPALAPGRV